MVNSSSNAFLLYTSLTKKSLHNYTNYLSSLLKKFNINFTIVSLPLKIKTKTLLKSPHVTKKAKESFELTFFKIIVRIKFDNKLIKILRTNLPNTMHLKCVIIS